MTATHPGVQRYVDALAVGDRATAFAVVREARAAGCTVLEVLTGLVAPAQHRIGELWASDRWSVAQEHAATAVSEAVVAVLGAEVEDGADGPSRTGGRGPVVVSCVEQEFHALPALLVSEHLRAAGTPVSYLGANASAEHLVRHVHQFGPRAVALSCSLGSSLVRVRQQIEAVRETGTPVLVGGAAFDADGARARTLGAAGYARSGTEAAAVVEALPRAVTPAEPLSHPGAAEARLVQSEREQIAAAVVAPLCEELLPDPVAPSGGWRQALHDHLPHVVGAVAGALVTDDALVAHDALDWFGAVLRHRNAPRDVPVEVRLLLTQQLRELPEASRMLASVPAA